MKKCTACRKPYRQGRMAFVMTKRGLKGARVCQTCAGGGALVVLAEAAEPCKCGKLAKVCGGCAVDAERKSRASVLADAIKAIGVLVKGAKLALGAAAQTSEDMAEADAELSGHADSVKDHIAGKVEALEDVVALLKEGRF